MNSSGLTALKKKPFPLVIERVQIGPVAPLLRLLHQTRMHQMQGEVSIAWTIYISASQGSSGKTLSPRSFSVIFSLSY